MRRKHPPCEELIEMIWQKRERDEKFSYEPQNPIHQRALAQELVKVDNHYLTFTPQGEALARGIIRRHRLAEVLFYQVMQLDLQTSESSACEMEHILSEEVTDRVCAFLGHPPICPHGHPIPPGKCCSRLKKELEIPPLVIPLSHAPLSKSFKIVYVAPKEKQVLSQLSLFGLIPGATLRLLQKRPSFVIKIGETTLALEKATAQAIYGRVQE